MLWLRGWQKWSGTNGGSPHQRLSYFPRRRKKMQKISHSVNLDFCPLRNPFCPLGVRWQWCRASASWWGDRDVPPSRPGGGGHWPRKGVWGCAALKTPFSRLSCSSQGSHFKQKSQFLLRKFGNFSLYSLNFCQNFSSQAPKLGNFQFTSPQNLEIFSSQAPTSEASISLQAPHFGWSGPGTLLPEKKLSAPQAQDPHFQVFLASQTHHFKPLSIRLLCLEKVCIFNWARFSPHHLAKFQLLRHKLLQKFVPEIQVSSQKISSGDPTFENLGGTYLPKNSPPPPTRLCLSVKSLYTLFL